MKTAKMPKMRDCRVDYREYNGQNYSFLVDYSDGQDQVIYMEVGVFKLKKLFGEFRFKVDGNMSIDNWNYLFMPYSFKKIDGVNYDYN